MDRYDTFCNAVTRALRGATVGERRAVARELREHLEDHAAALMEAGTDPETAACAAISAMGDPREIGAALAQSYPPFWRSLHTFLRATFVLLLALALWLGAARAAQFFSAVQENRAARSMVSSAANVLPIDAQMEVDGQILRVYGAKYTVAGGSYDSIPQLSLYVCSYSQIPWQPASEDLTTLLRVSDSRGNPLPSTCMLDQNNGSYATALIDILIDEPPGELILTFDAHGHDAALRFSVPVPEKLPDAWLTGGDAP